ncbi:acylphosphatase [Cryobacterium sp. PH31-L1]|uniref:acylphosphatase n=1 Tax=Cryobacterium sp. PH31-L1 TaxID=3046199 RepID=UPI0024B9DE0A|nr:acylphosphatase [Cryobacterium sp. PH31-L1]MDJ0376392.1 acylphosphatase [Cryobacterium sp. PH31-L1]
MIRKRVLARGEVQGVGFRYHARAHALHLGLVGYVRNRPDGSVELEIEGREASVSRMLLWLETGPRYAVVTAVEVSDVAVTGESQFQITD